jgi:acyl dehydratase
VTVPERYRGVPVADSATRALNDGREASALPLTFRMGVDDSKIAEMSRALHAHTILGDAAFLPDGSPRIVPTFTAVAWHSHDRVALYRDLGIDPQIALHGENEWTYHAPLAPGDRLTARISVAADTIRIGKRAGEMRAVEIVTEFLRDSEPVVTERTLLLVPRAVLDAPAPEPAPEDASEGADEHPAAAGPSIGPLTRTDFVRYAGASGDFSAVHHDEVLARSLGLPSVFSMGMLPAGMAGVHLLGQSKDQRLTNLRVRMTDRVWPGEVLSFFVVDRSTIAPGVTSVSTEVRAGHRVILRAEATMDDVTVDPTREV